MLPSPPTALSGAEERRHRKQCLAAGFRLFARFGLEEGAAGHITARDPNRTDCFWVNPLGMPFAHVRASDLLLLNGNPLADIFATERSISMVMFKGEMVDRGDLFEQ